MEPFTTEITIDVHKVGIEWLLADAEFVPGAKRWIQSLGQRAVRRSREIRRVNVDRFQLVILLDLVDLALTDNSISKDFVTMPGREHFILPDILNVVLCHVEFLHVQVLLTIVPLDLNHRLAGLLLAPAFLDDTENTADYRALLGLAEEGKFTHTVDHTAKHELAVYRWVSPAARCHIMSLVISLLASSLLLFQLLGTCLTTCLRFVDAFGLWEYFTARARAISCPSSPLSLIHI